MLLNKRSQRGDTIVEVLICVMVVGSVLAGAFVVTNRSQLGVRDSQEHAEASKVVESQLEQLRSNAKVQGGGVFKTVARNQPFCMVAAKPVTYATGTPDQKCMVDETGAMSTLANRYTILIKKIDDASGVQYAGSKFTITVSWASVGGRGTGTSQESMVYRIYP